MLELNNHFFLHQKIASYVASAQKAQEIKYTLSFTARARLHAVAALWHHVRSLAPTLCAIRRSMQQQKIKSCQLIAKIYAVACLRLLGGLVLATAAILVPELTHGKLKLHTHCFPFIRPFSKNRLISNKNAFGRIASFLNEKETALLKRVSFHVKPIVDTTVPIKMRYSDLIALIKEGKPLWQERLKYFLQFPYDEQDNFWSEIRNNESIKGKILHYFNTCESGSFQVKLRKPSFNLLNEFPKSFLEKIIYLDLSNSFSLSSTEMEKIALCINLKHLNLEACIGIRDANLRHLSMLNQLVHLDLTWCGKITDDGLQHLSGLKQLSYLSLKSCPQIREVSLKRLSSWKSLTHLNLSCCRFTNTGLQQLSVMNQLVELDISYCDKTTTDGVNNLKTALKNTKIQTTE